MVWAAPPCASSFFFFNDTATTEIYPLSLHDALPIWVPKKCRPGVRCPCSWASRARPKSTIFGSPEILDFGIARPAQEQGRSEEHTSELQSLTNLLCRLLLGKKKNPAPPPGPRHPASH